MKKKRKKRQKEHQDRSPLTLCAVQNCGHKAISRHHFIPNRFVPDNPFTIQLCEKHHQIADEMLAEITEATPLTFFKFIFELVYGHGLAYRRLNLEENVLEIPKISIHYSSGERKGDD